MIVCGSAEVGQAVGWCALGIWGNGGQDCSAGSRVFVHEVSSHFFSMTCSGTDETVWGSSRSMKNSWRN